eukprot:CAMPEP_0206182946 /NCGR_PEP_ID=MMETSP0166-20121206/353_1 /ASSEMBLY_ACC=CAM_ASM_000260 /TAXON_ID=95228 /ORGANISM="Vannella robusta, Strain DIVA3 518/3/11/1/6" /LENGTH=214 /DNA_ID=CAMNT_0053597723 /DNA_START=546 /DNA_END=1190 /DNA_ORIENTATION=-
MYKIDEQISQLSAPHKPVARLIMNIHDELVYEVAVEHKRSVMEMIRDQMEDAVCLTTSIPVCVFEGTQFGSLREVKFEKQSVFMAVLKKENSPYIVHRGEHVSCIMSTNPVSDGHCVVLPNNSVEDWDKIPSDVLTSAMALCKEVAGYLRVLYPSSTRILLESGSPELRHAHFHLVPVVGNAKITVPDYQESIDSIARQQIITAEAARLKNMFE